MKSKGTESTLCFHKLVILYQNCVLSPRAYQHRFSFEQLISITRPKEEEKKKKERKTQNAICAVSEWGLKFTTSLQFKRMVVFCEHTRAAYFNLTSTIVGLMKNELLFEIGKWNFPPSRKCRHSSPYLFPFGKHLQTWIYNSLDNRNLLMFPIEAYLSSTPLTGILIFKEKEAELHLGVQPGKYLIVD